MVKFNTDWHTMNSQDQKYTNDNHEYKYGGIFIWH